MRTKKQEVESKERFSFMVSYFADGELDAVAMSNKESTTYAHAVGRVFEVGWRCSMGLASGTT